MSDMAQAKKIAAELGLDEEPDQREKLSPMESAYRMTPNYYVEQMEKRKHEASEPDDGKTLAEDYGMTGQPPRPEPRDLDVITQEIVFYKRQAGAALMEIGSRLNEAKSQLEHGQWLDWLREKVDISERNAQNFMRIAREYSKSAEIADLGATKALALLALPDSERESFLAEKHVVNGEEKAVADMTGEELKKAIRERDEALKQAQEAQDGLSDAKRERDEAKKAGEQATAKLDALKVKSDGLEEKLKAARAKEKETKAGLENAKTEKAELEKKLEELRKKPVDVAVREPGEEELKKLREEAEAAAADKDTQTFKFFFDEWQRKYSAMTEALQAVADTDPEKAEKLKTAIRAAAERMGGAAE
jgi:chromosome segregation ATPase